MSPKPHSSYHALSRKASINIAVDVDLTLLDTLTPWLEAYGVDIEDIDYHDEQVWQDLSPWLEEHATAHPNWKKPYEYWNDPLTYIDAKLNPGVMEFLKKLESYINTNTEFEAHFFICSSCTVHHKVAKDLRIKELCGDFFQGFVDTADKHLVDFDILFDDSPSQALNAYKSGKLVALVPAPMNNPHHVLKEIVEHYDQWGAPTQSGNIIGLCTDLSVVLDDSQQVDLDNIGITEYNGFWNSFMCAEHEMQQTILEKLTSHILKHKAR